MRSYYAAEAELKSIADQKMALVQRIADSHEDEEKSKAAQSMNPAITLNRLRQEIKACEEQARGIEASILRLDEEQERAEKAMSRRSEQMTACEQEAGVLLEKRRELGVEEDLMEEDIGDPVAELRDISNQNSMRRKYYTARDRLFFSKIATIRSGYESFRKRLQQILQSEEALNELMRLCDLEAAGAMESMVVRFQNHFRRILQQIVP